MSTEEEENSPEPIKYHPLHDYLKMHTTDETQIKAESSEFMQLQLEVVAEKIIQAAEKKAEEEDMTRVHKRHIEDAFEDAFGAHKILNEAVTVMGEYESELKRIGSDSPVLDFEVGETDGK